MGARFRPLSYQVKSRLVAGGEYRPFACAACHVCGTYKEIRQGDKPNNPEFVEKKFRAEGWAFSAWNPREITCPDCIEKRRAARRGESGTKGQGGAVVTLTLNGQGGAAAKPPSKTELTVEERTRVRDLLGGCFDEKAGQYSEDWSDIRVAKEAGDLPPKLVADLREFAFGPLRSVSEIETLRADLGALQARALDEIAKLSAAFGVDLEKLRTRFDEAAKRLGVRS